MVQKASAAAPVPVRNYFVQSYTLQAADNGGVLTLTNANPIAVTVPPSLPVGFKCEIVQGGAGMISVSGAFGCTVNNPQGQSRSGGVQDSLTVIMVSPGVAMLRLGGGSGGLAGSIAIMAPGDGTTDAAAHIRAQLQAGRVHFLPPAVNFYLLNSALIPPAGATIVGLGNPTMKFVGAITGGACVITGGDGVVLRGLTIDADKSSKGPQNSAIKLVNNEAIVEDCTILNANYCGIQITGDSNKVRRNKIRSSGGPQIQILGPTVLAAPGTAGGSHNLLEFNDVTGGSGFGIHIEDAAHDNVIQVNRCTQSGLELVGLTYGCYANQILFNHAEGTGDNGISVTGYRNVVEGNICRANAHSGIHLYGRENTCSDNQCINNNQARAVDGTSSFSGITLGASWGGLSSSNSVSNNICIDDQATPTQDYGINLQAAFYPAWASGGALTTYPYVSNGLNIYKRVGGSTTTMGTQAPVHTSGDQFDGSVTWRYVATADTNLHGKYNSLTGNICRGNRTAPIVNGTGNAHTIFHDGMIVLNGNLGTGAPNLPIQILSGNGSPATLGVIGNPGDFFMRKGGGFGITAYLKEGGSNDTSNWVALLTRKFGTTANRPSGLGLGYQGAHYYDTDMDRDCVWGQDNAWHTTPQDRSFTTAGRPTGPFTANQYIGWDTTINKAIWRNTANTGFVDAMGTAA